LTIVAADLASASHPIAMVRRGSKRSNLKDGSAESPTHETLQNGKTRGASPGRFRSKTPTREKDSRDRPSLLRRRSKRNNNLSNPWTDDLTDGISNHDTLVSLTQHSTLQTVPSHWTTASGKFDPKRSELGFDNISNMAINVNSGISTNSFKSVSNDSEYSQSNLSDDTKPKPKTNKHKSKKGESSPLVEGEIVDYLERHQFYKKLKKAGIKKTIAIDEDWGNSSACSGVSELSTGNASYILDLAQQKENRKRNREEVALEEALELYGTWLTEGKNDDKNIFLMILHEVKKEQKANHKKADKLHSALLDAALDEELKRRAQIKEEEKEEEEERAKAAAQKKEPEIMPVPDDSITAESSHKRHLSFTSGQTRKSFHSKQCESKISEILTTQSILAENNDKESSDDNESFHEEYSEAFEHAESSGIEHTESSEIDATSPDDIPKPSSERSRSRSSGRRSRRFGWFGSNVDVMDQSQLPRSDPQMYAHSHHDEKGDSKRMFSRLRRQLSERQLEQRKEEEKSWKKNDHVVTNEEKWWNKINDAKKENVMFEKSIAVLNLTTRSNPFGGISPKKPNTTVKLDSTTRTAPGRMPNAKIVSNSTNNPSSINVNLNQHTVTNTATPLTAETEKKVKHEKKKLSTPKKKKKVTSVSDSLDGSKEVNSEKKKKKKKVSETGDTSSVVSDFDGQKSTKSKDKKKKKNSKVAEGDEKKKKTSKDGSKNGSVIGSIDGSDAKSSTKSGRKKKSKVSIGENLDAETSPTKKLHKIAKKKKKKAKSSEGSCSGDAIYGNNHGENSSCDWTHRCIIPSTSDETGSATVLTMESTLQ
jgi:hypothetical protein